MTRACCALLDLADDDALADHHLHGVDGAGVGQRIDIDRLDPAFGRIVEHLGDAGADGRAADHEIDVGAEPRRFDKAAGVRVALLVVAFQQQRAGPRLAGRDEQPA